MFDRRNMILAGLLVAALPASAQEARLPVVASCSILADLVRQIGKDRVAVTEMIGPNQDAHVYQPGPADAKKLAAARLVVLNGLGLEPAALTRMIAATPGAQTITLSDGVATRKRPAAGHDHGHSKTNTAKSDAADPHLWQSVANVKAYARALAAKLAALDPGNAAAYQANLAAYLADLEALDADVRAAIAAIPPERRVFATTHDAFGYFAVEYGVSIQTLQGVSTESEPSAADMARIIRQLKALKSPAVFLENVSDPRKAQMIARETGAAIGGTLYSDSLSLANGPAPTYIDMMRHNVREIAKALK